MLRNSQHKRWPLPPSPTELDQLKKIPLGRQSGGEDSEIQVSLVAKLTARRFSVQECASKGMWRQGIVSRHWNFLQKEPTPCCPMPLLVWLWRVPNHISLSLYIYIYIWYTYMIVCMYIYIYIYGKLWCIMIWYNAMQYHMTCTAPPSPPGHPAYVSRECLGRHRKGTPGIGDVDCIVMCSMSDLSLITAVL